MRRKNAELIKPNRYVTHLGIRWKVLTTHVLDTGNIELKLEDVNGETITLRRAPKAKIDMA
jgi:hypothetical protein